ncbi:2'-5' RNA ligase family protein [Curtobacterium sp. PhB130]|uniref:2'-5' RNA ligase family protein n=1 Tax=Curtobacterium sp. PhB130 TaxID=2485178 RepID=UPI000F4CAFEC|nr:2'-5' RNA ligase family protein [Curtobacterium sp. PhB130]
MKSYAVVALFDPLDVGAVINRRAWPAHVTLASNFVTSASTSGIARAVYEAAPVDAPMRVHVGEQALFGPNRDVRVRLVDSNQAVSVHNRLADQFESLPGFVPEEPAYWRQGYRPHLTLGPAAAAGEGDRETSNCVVIVEIRDTDARVLAAFNSRGAL